MNNLFTVTKETSASEAVIKMLEGTLYYPLDYDENELFVEVLAKSQLERGLMKYGLVELIESIKRNPYKNMKPLEDYKRFWEGNVDEFFFRVNVRILSTLLVEKLRDGDRKSLGDRIQSLVLDEYYENLGLLAETDRIKSVVCLMLNENKYRLDIPYDEEAIEIHVSNWIASNNKRPHQLRHKLASIFNETCLRYKNDVERDLKFFDMVSYDVLAPITIGTNPNPNVKFSVRSGLSKDSNRKIAKVVEWESTNGEDVKIREQTPTELVDSLKTKVEEFNHKEGFELSKEALRDHILSVGGKMLKDSGYVSEEEKPVQMDKPPYRCTLPNPEWEVKDGYVHLPLNIPPTTVTLEHPNIMTNEDHNPFVCFAVTPTLDDYLGEDTYQKCRMIAVEEELENNPEFRKILNEHNDNVAMLTNPYLDITDEARRRAEDMSRRVWEKFGDLPNVDQDELKRRIDEFVSEFYPDRKKNVKGGLC